MFKEWKFLTVFTLSVPVALLLFYAASQLFIKWDAADYRAFVRHKCLLADLERASRIYHVEYGQWPVSLAGLTNNPRAIPFIKFDDLGITDYWSHPLIYQPFDAAKGYGAVISYGRDGQPGGTGEDADLEVRFGP
ncbi:MAG: type II secretion system protein GspG [Kiritimatiellaeota bacterium]|nr:type II secretion system protein GspG [Kiritimatiellota bacterium]